MRLDHRRHLVRTRQRPRAAIHQTGQAVVRVEAEPVVHGLAGHPEPPSDIGDRHPVVADLQHGLIALLHQSQLHHHDRPPSHPRARTTTAKKETTG
jgi:hypothetical protein